MLSWFKKKSDEDYEQVLASLALSIQKQQTQLSEIRLRERRATLLVTIWAFSAWAGYVALWWTGVLGQKGRGVKNAVWGLPVVIGPIVEKLERSLSEATKQDRRDQE
ncbi:hypothetical protein Clacol_009493 [Clathrus columnatus]|uniref:Uncharacterized protein n=1 Tax=Clathrus columnatus TaxID=1419009 RepID=A0AAV5AN44_9AGAM|nr:hypothetical protein Clacol_009493 [Clathrus columnatus]